VTSYTHSTGAVVSSDASGLIRYWALESSGATTGFVLEQKFNRDLDSDEYLEWSRTFEIGSLVVGDTTVYRPLVDDEREYPVAVTSGTSGSNLFARAFTWHSSSLSPKEITVTWPTVTTANNGSNSATTSRVWLDQVGRTVWTQAEDGVIDYTRYSGGVVTMTIRDADTTLTGGGQVFNGLTMPGWTLGSGLVHRIEQSAYDDGFQPTVTHADGRVLVGYTSVLEDRRSISLSYPAMAGGYVYGPVEFNVQNHARRSEAQGRVALAGNDEDDDFTAHVDETESDPLLALDLGTVCRYRTSLYNESGTELEYARTYFDVPGSGAGSSGTNYDEEEYAYDAMGRQNRRELPHVGIPGGGTIYRTSYDILGRVAARSMGTDDSGTGSDNMVVTELLEYDGGGDDGNSLLTERILRTTASSSDERPTGYAHDVRGQLLLTTGATAPHSLVKYDNMGRELARGEYSSAPSPTADPTSTTSGRTALSSTEYDQRGRVMRSHFYNIDPSNGTNTSSEKVTTDYWYDGTGRTLKVEGAKLSKTFYDRLGRETHSFVLATTDDGFDSATYGKVDDVSGDIVLVEHQTVYESTSSDEVVMRATIERFHDDYGGGETTGALDTNADNDRMVVTAGNLEGRSQITAMWHDDLGRLENVVAYGTNGGSTFTRTALSVPARGPNALRTTYDYDDTGEQFSVVDPKGAEARFGFDDAGRQTSVTQNYEDGTPESLEPDKDQIVRYGYANGLRTTYTADLPSSDQVTTYIYGTARSGSSVEDSLVATSHLLYQVQYPDYDSGASPVDRMTYAYNAQGEEIFRQDQDGTVLEKTYDLAGRLVTDAASALGTDIDDLGIGTDIDGAVRRKEYAYDGLGRMTTATQYSATTSGTLVDQVAYTYGEWGRMTAFSLDVDSAVVGGSGIAPYTCAIDYTRTWAAITPASRSGSRLVVADSVTLPGGAFYSFVQDSTGYHEQAGRTSSVKDGVPTTVATFQFVGDRRVSKVALEVHDFVMDYADGASGGSYADWDRFNRVIEDEWHKDLATDRKFLHRKYTLDEGGFITEVYDPIEVDTSSDPTMDTMLTLDDLNRLTGLQRGELNPTTHTISAESMEWTRTLDVVGNMSNYLLDWTGDGDSLDADEYDTDLTFSTANEIATVDTVAATYSKSGMLLNDLRLKYKYDAWSRIVKVINASNSATLANYRRNALNYLIGEQLDRQPDTYIDGNDYWEYFLTRPSDMGMLASFRGSDIDPLVERLWLGDLESSATGSFYAPAVLESRDDNYDGTIDRDTVLFIDRTGSVIGNYGDEGSNGRQVERLHYNMTSQPFLMAWGDVDGDGDADSSDESWIGFLWSFSFYDVRADLDIDGDVDSADYSAHATGGGGVRVSNDTNRLSAQALHMQYGLTQAVARGLQSTIGTWTRRDPANYSDGPSLYADRRSNPFAYVDRLGLESDSTQCGEPTGSWPHNTATGGFINAPTTFALNTGGQQQDDCGARVRIDNPPSAWCGNQSCNSFISVGMHPTFDFGTRDGSCIGAPLRQPCRFDFRVRLNIEQYGVGTGRDEATSDFYDQWHTTDIGDDEPPQWDHSGDQGGSFEGAPGTPGISGSYAGYRINTTVACGQSKSYRITAQSHHSYVPPVELEIRVCCTGCPSFFPVIFTPPTEVVPSGGTNVPCWSGQCGGALCGSQFGRNY
jgi:YD repeat-containing protein